MAKVVHIISSLGVGGCERFLVNTLPLVDAYDHQIITLNQRGELADELTKRGIGVKRLESFGVFRPWTYGRLVAYLKKVEPDLIITYLLHADVLGRLVLQSKIKTPIVSFLRTTYNDTRYWPARLFERMSKRWAGRYFANSEAVKQHYVTHFGVDGRKISVIPNGVDCVTFAPANREKFRQKLSIPPETLVITCVANLHPNKGQSDLVEAAKVLANESSRDFVVLLVGSGPCAARLERQIAESGLVGRVQLLGARRDVADILRATDVFMFPTYFEGMSNALLEAAASGCAIVASDIAENRAVLKNALFVPVKDSQAIAQCLKRLLSDAASRHRLAQKAREETARRHALPVAAQRFSREIRAAIGGSRG